MDPMTPNRIIVQFLTCTNFEQLGCFTKRSKTDGVIQDRKDITIAPFKEIIKSKSGVIAAATTKGCQM